MRNLWYVRHGDQVSGPYPQQLVARYVLLGRFKRRDLVSVDERQWVPLEEVRELLPDEPPHVAEKNPVKRNWREERKQARQRWFDERRLPDRRKPDNATGQQNDNRRSRDRRKNHESAEVLALRQRHVENELWLKQKRERFFTIALVLLALAFGMLLLTNLVSPVQPIKVGLAASRTDCMQPAAPQINWSGCDKNGIGLINANLKSARLVRVKMQGAHLRGSNLSYALLAGADLTFADLSHSVLQGANLTGADLNSANLSQADLRYADLRGASLAEADLHGAQLGNAIWPNGKVCAESSIGQCM